MGVGGGGEVWSGKASQERWGRRPEWGGVEEASTDAKGESVVSRQRTYSHGDAER